MFPNTSALNSVPLLVTVFKATGEQMSGPWPIRDLLPGERLGKLLPSPDWHVLRDVAEPSDMQPGSAFTDEDRKLLQGIAAALGVR
jgi:hypothetical protein